MRWFVRKNKKRSRVEQASAAPGERRKVWVPKPMTNGKA